MRLQIPKTKQFRFINAHFASPPQSSCLLRELIYANYA